ncbi:MAG: LexA family transcriptional regulator [Bacteroidota bacterium]
MAVLRKEKHSYIGQNLLYLRKQKGNTLEQMADLLFLKGKSSYKAYEEGRSLPDIHKLMKLASYFDISLEEMVYQDIEHLKAGKKTEDTKFFEVEKVPLAAAAGYAKSFGDIGYIRELEKITIPFQPYGIARAFDIEGDSMEPEISDGATVVGIKISTSEIKDNKAYIVVTTDGLQCKNIQVDEEGKIIYLISKNQKYRMKHIEKADVMEIWEVWRILQN